MNEDKKCGTCLYFNGEVGDGIQFCDEKEINVSEHRWCVRYRSKDNGQTLAKMGEKS